MNLNLVDVKDSGETITDIQARLEICYIINIDVHVGRCHGDRNKYIQSLDIHTTLYKLISLVIHSFVWVRLCFYRVVLVK